MTDGRADCGLKEAGAAAKLAELLGAAAAFCGFVCIMAEVFRNVVSLLFYLAVALPLAALLWKILVA